MNEQEAKAGAVAGATVAGAGLLGMAAAYGLRVLQAETGIPPEVSGPILLAIAGGAAGTLRGLYLRAQRVGGWLR